MLSISFIYEYNAASLIDIENEHTLIYIYRLSLSHTNKEKKDNLIVLCSLTLFSHSFIRIIKT
jgi:hypothetical protein